MITLVIIGPVLVQVIVAVAIAVAADGAVIPWVALFGLLLLLVIGVCVSLTTSRSSSLLLLSW
jgi:hypothetical protein